MSKYNWKEILSDLDALVKIKYPPIGIKLLEKKEDLDKIEKLRRPKHVHSPCQIMGQAIQNGFTMGYTADDIPLDNCKGISGLIPQDESWKSGAMFAGVWFETPKDSKAHQDAVNYIPHGKYEAVVISPLKSGRLPEPDVCLMTGTPGQMFIFLSGYLRSDYTPLDCTIMGESSCSSTWVKAFKTGKPCLAMPCFAELRYAGFSDGEMILGITPDAIVKAIAGMKDLSKVGLRYPVPNYAVQCDVREGLGKSYDIK